MASVVTTVLKRHLGEKVMMVLSSITTVGRRKAHVKTWWTTGKTGVKWEVQRMAISLSVEIDILGGQFVGSQIRHLLYLVFWTKQLE